jgi:exoribonuclease-2
MDLHKNQVIDYYDGRRISCGLVLDIEDRRARILGEQGKELKISPARVLMSGKDPHFPLTGSRDEQVSRLRDISLQREELKVHIDLPELWDVVGTEARQMDIHELGELLFGDRPSLDSVAALLRAIFEDRLYFKIKPDGIEIPEPEVVQQALQQRDRERERQEFTARAAEFLVRVKNEPHVSAEDAPNGLTTLLEDGALLAKEWITVKPVKDIFAQAGLPPQWDPFRVLVKLGVWSEDENVTLRAENIPIEFSDEAKEKAALLAAEPVRTDVEDLTDLAVVTIDAETTRDIDDGLSLTVEGEECVLGIHITDVASYIEHDSEFDREIRLRATSIYLPEMIIPMIPPSLSEQAASLIVGEPRRAISVLVRLGKDFKVRDFRIVPSLIKSAERLTYDEVDARISRGEGAEATMFAIASALRQERSAAGALIFRDPELSVRVADDGTIDVSIRNRESPSQIVVSELMILANHLFARFLKENGLPGIYRVQPPPLEKVDLGQQFDPVQSYRCKKLLSRGDVSVQPSPHSTLGLEVYTTATSPLRRYPDLLVQRQLKAALEKETDVLPVKELERILTTINFRLDRAVQLERERQRYFLLKYLGTQRHQEYEAVVLHRFPRFHLVHVFDLGLNAALVSSNNLSLNPYDRAIIRIEKVNPREDRLSLALVKLL